MKNKSLSYKIAFGALMSAVAIVFGYIEMLFPIPIPVPGVKIGWGNIVILICLYCADKKMAWYVMLTKVLVTTLLFASPSMMIYSLFGGIFSVSVMQLMKRFSFNIITVSIGGGIFHNIGQLIAAMTVLGSINILYYAPILIAAGTGAALITGIVARAILPGIKRFIK